MSSPSYSIIATDTNGVEKEYPGGVGSDVQSWVIPDKIIAKLKADSKIVKIIIVNDWGGTPQVIKQL
jgi:hypothetical protein